VSDTQPQYKQFFPLKTIHSGAPSPQWIHPAVDLGGTPTWQPGDTNRRDWEITSAGWCHGAPSNRRDNPDIRGKVFLTGARVVVISDRFTHGARYRSYSLGLTAVLAGVATKVSDVRARHATEGTFLVGHIRHPWLTSVVFGPPGASKRLRGEVRLCAQHLSAFGEPEPVMLIFKFKSSDEVPGFVDDLVGRVREDRRNWVSEDAQLALDRLPTAGCVTAPEGSLPINNLAGALRVARASVSRGSQSSRSFPGDGRSRNETSNQR
jgi:hypothetical protein